MGHDHTHGTLGAAHSHARPLGLALALVLAYMGVEVVGGLLSGSLALLADAGHMLSDAGALTLTLFAMKFARRPATGSQTYGYYRAEILAALVNGVTLVAIAIFIFLEAYERMRNPSTIAGPLMLAVAGGGLVVNAAGLWILRSDDESLSMRGASLHVLTDLLGSVQAILAGGLIWMFGWTWTDPLASMLIGGLIIYSSWSLIRQTVAVLMEGAPGHIDVDEVRAALLEIPDVSNVHDLHVWTITSGFVSLSAHLTCVDPEKQDDVLRSAHELMASRFGVRHTTFQIDRGPSCEGTVHASG
jgi:cobalt-zinc-cadmium efflux system protein